MWCLEAGNPEGIPLLLIHGNTSNAMFWLPLMEHLSDDYYVIAPDLTGFGRTEFRPVLASTGVQDWSEDLIALLDCLMLPSCVMVSHSMGGIIGWDLLRRHASRINWMIQIAPGSPFGFGGTMHESGLPTWPDFAGSGAGLGSEAILRILQTPPDQRTKVQLDSMRTVLRTVIISAAEVSPWEDVLIESMLQTRPGVSAWPGDTIPSRHWPGFGPGLHGVLNALSPKYLKHLTRGVADVQRLIWSVDSDYSRCVLPHVSWIRGDADKLVSDVSHADYAGQGKLGLRKDWPGISQSPPQPMVSQIRAYLDSYRRAHGSYEEIVIPGAGHSPHIQDPVGIADIIRYGIDNV